MLSYTFKTTQMWFADKRTEEAQNIVDLCIFKTTEKYGLLFSTVI